MDLENKPLAVITIIGVPVAWKSHAGYGRKSFNPLWREREMYQEKIREQYHGGVLEIAVSCEYIFYRKIPESTSKKMRDKLLLGNIRPICRPDRDNYDKFLSDCLQGIVIEDDSQIVDGPVRKFYDDEPYTVIKIWSV